MVALAARLAPTLIQRSPVKYDFSVKRESQIAILITSLADRADASVGTDFIDHLTRESINANFNAYRCGFVGVKVWDGLT